MDECAKWSDTRNGTFNFGAFLQAFNLRNPWIFYELLHRKAEAFLIDSDDFGFDSVTNLDVVRWVVDALPRDFRDVDEAFDAINIDEDAKVYNTGNNTFYNIANFEFSKAFSKAVFNSFLLREDKLVFLLDSIKNADLDGFANERVKTLQNLVFVSTANTWVVLSRKL